MFNHGLAIGAVSKIALSDVCSRGQQIPFGYQEQDLNGCLAGFSIERNVVKWRFLKKPSALERQRLRPTTYGKAQLERGSFIAKFLSWLHFAFVGDASLTDRLGRLPRSKAEVRHRFTIWRWLLAESFLFIRWVYTLHTTQPYNFFARGRSMTQAPGCSATEKKPFEETQVVVKWVFFLIFFYWL